MPIICLILAEDLTPKVPFETQFQNVDIKEPSRNSARDLKKQKVQIKKNNCPQLFLGSLYSDCSYGKLLLNSILNVALKAFQRGPGKAGCTLVNWKLFVTNHPSLSLSQHSPSERGGALGQKVRSKSRGHTHPDLPLSFCVTLG